MATSYFVTELLGTNLHCLLTSRPLEKQFIQYFLYQILRGSSTPIRPGSLHRDLKPSNILINENCDLKVGSGASALIRRPSLGGRNAEPSGDLRLRARHGSRIRG